MANLFIVAAILLLLVNVSNSVSDFESNDIFNSNEEEEIGSTFCRKMTSTCKEEYSRKLPVCNCFREKAQLCCDLNLEILTGSICMDWFRTCKNFEVYTPRNSYVITSKDCDINFGDAHCDMSEITKRLFISSNSGINASTIQIINGRRLQMGHHCFESIYLRKVHLEEISDEKSCDHQLDTLESTIETISNSVVRLFATETNLFFVNAKLQYAVVSDSDIDILTGSVVHAVCSYSVISRISNLRIEKYFKINTSKIRKILKDGLFIQKNSKVVIENGNITRIDETGITVKGHLLLQNVFIKYINPNCFSVHNSSKVSFVNVSIENVSENLFRNDSQIDFKLIFKNVTMSGKIFTAEEAFSRNALSVVPKDNSALILTFTLIIVVPILIIIMAFAIRRCVKKKIVETESEDNIEESRILLNKGPAKQSSVEKPCQSLNSDVKIDVDINKQDHRMPKLVRDVVTEINAKREIKKEQKRESRRQEDYNLEKLFSELDKLN